MMLMFFATYELVPEYIVGLDLATTVVHVEELDLHVLYCSYVVVPIHVVDSLELLL